MLKSCTLFCREYPHKMLARRLLFLEIFRIDSLHWSGVFGVRWRCFDPASARIILLWSFVYFLSHVSYLSPSSSLCGVAGLAKTFPSITVSGPFLPDAPRFHVPPGRILPPQLWSSSRALPLHLQFDNCSAVLGFVSSFDVAKPLFS